MNFRALRRFRQKLSLGECVHGLWVTLESPSITEIAVSLGMDWVVVDAEHGHLDWRELNEHIRAAVRSDTVVLVRLAERGTALSKRALDIGADGVVIPWVESVAELEASIRDCRYPPEGRRGIGGERATAWGQCLAEHARHANEHVLVVPLIESMAAVPNVSAMCQVDGAEIFFFGPADFSATAGYRGQWEGPGVAEQILDLKETITAAGHHCGLMVTGIDNLVQRREQGFQMLGVASDTGLIIRGLHQSLKAVGCDRSIPVTLDASDGRVLCEARVRPQLEPDTDRMESVQTLAAANSVDLEQGVVFRPLVGASTAARGLTTGIAVLDTGAVLPWHRHPCTESVTVLEGETEIAVEGRVYRLQPMDTIVIPRWLPHTTRNASPDQVTRLHNTFGQCPPERELVSYEFQADVMPSESQGWPGAEWVTRSTAVESMLTISNIPAVADTSSAELVPGIEFSGSMIRLQPGDVIQAAVASEDQSVCVVQGSLTANVDDRCYTLGKHDTLFVPAGRVSRLSNESQRPVDLIRTIAAPKFTAVPVAAH